MRKLDTYQRRSELLTLLYTTPMSSTEAASIIGASQAEINNDVGHLQKYGVLVKHGKEKRTYSQGGTREVIIWRALEKMDPRSIEHLIVSYNKKKEELPDLPNELLLMMGFAIHKPKNARYVNNEGFRNDVPLRKHHVHIGSNWDNLALLNVGV